MAETGLSVGIQEDIWKPENQNSPFPPKDLITWRPKRYERPAERLAVILKSANPLPPN